MQRLVGCALLVLLWTIGTLTEPLPASYAIHAWGKTRAKESGWLRLQKRSPANGQKQLYGSDNEDMEWQEAKASLMTPRAVICEECMSLCMYDDSPVSFCLSFQMPGFFFL
jgi:hypothetical protein